MAEIIPGGRYVNAGGNWTNANGQYITKDGEPSEEPIKAKPPKGVKAPKQDPDPNAPPAT